MSRTAIDVVVTLALFAIGMGWTVFRYGKRDRLVFAVVAVLSPLIVFISVFRLLYLVLTHRVKIGPCPAGLSEAEQLVEAERQRMFGGELREPTMARNWQRAYETELQHGAERIQRFAQRVLVNA
jgi:hypothetical protein